MRRRRPQTYADITISKLRSAPKVRRRSIPLSSTELRFRRWRKSRAVCRLLSPDPAVDPAVHDLTRIDDMPPRQRYGSAPLAAPRYPDVRACPETKRAGPAPPIRRAGVLLRVVGWQWLQVPPPCFIGRLVPRVGRSTPVDGSLPCFTNLASARRYIIKALGRILFQCWTVR
jgi:hypothetical protein